MVPAMFLSHALRPNSSSVLHVSSFPFFSFPLVLKKPGTSTGKGIFCLYAANNVLLLLFYMCCLYVVKADVCVDSLIPGLEAPQPQRHSGQPELIPASMPG